MTTPEERKEAYHWAAMALQDCLDADGAKASLRPAVRHALEEIIRQFHATSLVPNLVDTQTPAFKNGSH